MPVIQRIEQSTPEDPEFLFFCPGCKEGHWFKTTGGHPLWAWNGDFDKPTINPSIHVAASRPEHRCHSWVRDGRIKFLRDSAHALSGQTVDLPEIE